MEIFRNPNGDFELLFPLINPDGSGDWISGMAGDLDSNTIKISYHNATVWTTASFAAGTPVEINSTGSYHITIINTWFTARDEDFPIIVKIIDDTAIKQWIDQGAIINGKVDLEKVKAENGNSFQPSVEISAIDLLGTANRDAITITSQSGGGSGINMNVDDFPGININVNNGRGILIGSDLAGIDIASWSGIAALLTGFGGSAVRLRGDTANPTLDIENTSTGKAIETHNNDASSPTIHEYNAGDGNVRTTDAQGTGNAHEYISSTGQDIKAKELDAVLSDTNAVVAKLPLTGRISNLELTTVIDGTDLESLFSILKGFKIGKYVKDSPNPGQLTVFKNDNVTPLAIVSITDTERNRLLP